MSKVVPLTLEQVKQLVVRRLEACKKHRQRFEPQWQDNYVLINTDRANLSSQYTASFESAFDLDAGEVDNNDSEIGMNYAFKYLRFFHSQLSANPPSVIAKPTSSDMSDKRAADAADRIVRYFRTAKDLDEIVDQQILSTLTYGTGWLKCVWNPERGDVADYDESTRELTMEGDIEAYSPSTFDVWIDPDARTWKDVRFIIERLTIPYEEAVFRFPEQREILKKHLVTSKNIASLDIHENEVYTEQVHIYEYYEKSLPVNGMAGRHVWFLADGTLLKPPSKNPHPKAQLPYHIFTYVDVPNQVYGKSIVDYVARLQDMLNRLDSQILDVLQAHTTVRMAIPEGADIEDEAISNSTWDWVKYSGGTPPHFIAPTQLPGDPWKFREQLTMAIQDLYGVNDAMMGIQRRETSASPSKQASKLAL